MSCVAFSPVIWETMEMVVHAGDDESVPVENCIRYCQACIKNKVPAEMHLYPKGGHGFGMNNKTTADKWFGRLINWMNTL